MKPRVNNDVSGGVGRRLNGRLHQAGKPAGFTLLEVLIALGIVSVIAIMSWRGLEEVLSMADRLGRLDAQLQETNALFGQLQKDLANVENQLSKGEQFSKDTVSLDQTGLNILSTQRQKGRPAYQQQISWQLTEAGLIRTSNEIGVENEQVQQTEPLPVKGMAIRLFTEGNGFTNTQNFGEVLALNQVKPNYKGRPNPLTGNQQGSVPAGVAVGGANADGDAPQTAPITRAVEITLTMNDGRSLQRFFLLGGLR